MTKIQKAGLSINLKMCFFSQQRVDEPGHIISPEKLRIAEKSYDTIKGQIPPKTRTDVCNFLGLCNFYRRFVKFLVRIDISLPNDSRRRREKLFRH